MKHFFIAVALILGSIGLVACSGGNTVPGAEVSKSVS
ncbi:Uncharacterised protein [Legionella hackeliae]|nr:Uncharacterised protein [Legionella hackeliae]